MADADQLTYILSGDSFESLSFKPLDWPLTLYAFIYSFGSIEKVQLKTGVKKEKQAQESLAAAMSLNSIATSWADGCIETTDSWLQLSTFKL